MAKVCDKCGRGPKTGLTRSHSMIGTKRRFNLNLQDKRIEGKRLRICTSCIKTASKKAA